jgi:quercetin dioxygenase-like cupin family protein
MDKRQAIAISEFVSERTPRPLMGPILNFDLDTEMASLREEDGWRAHGHNARTLIKHSEFRVVLIALRVGSQVHEQQTDERLAIQTLRGRVRLHVPTESVELRINQLVSLDRHIPFSLEALEDCDFLLWLGWSKD